MRWSFFSCVLVLCLVSCQKPLTVLVLQGEPGLLAQVKAQSAQLSRKDIVVTDQPEQALHSENLVVLSTQLGWNLPEGAPAPTAIPSSWDTDHAYSPLAPLARWVQEADGSWTALPLFFDAFGVTTFRKEKDTSPLPPQDWSKLLTAAAVRSITVDGSRPSFRQASVFLAELDKPGLPGSAFSWFVQRPAAWQTAIRNLGPSINHPSWSADTWHFARADVLSDYGPATKHWFVETFRDYSLTNAAGTRVFQPLKSTEPAGYALAGQVVFLQFRGDSGQLEADLPMIRALTGTAFHNAVGAQTKWLSANLNAAEIDGTGAMVRRLAQGASRFYPVSDDLPRPLVEGNLFVDIQLAVDRTPRK